MEWVYCFCIQVGKPRLSTHGFEAKKWPMITVVEGVRNNSNQVMAKTKDMYKSTSILKKKKKANLNSQI